MSEQATARHPFLDDLQPAAELTSTILRGPVKGPEHIRRVVEMVGTFYRSQTPTFYQTVGDRSLLQYNAVLSNGMDISAVAVIRWDADGTVSNVSVTFSPLDSALSLAVRLGASLEEVIEPQLFL